MLELTLNSAFDSLPAHTETGSEQNAADSKIEGLLRCRSSVFTLISWKYKDYYLRIPPHLLGAWDQTAETSASRAQNYPPPQKEEEKGMNE